MNHLIIYLLLVQFINVSFSFPEPGIFNFNLENKTCNLFHVNKALFENTRISFKMLCKSNDDVKVKLGVLVRESECFEEYYYALSSVSSALSFYYKCPNFNSKSVHYIKKEVEVSCDNYIEQNLLDTNLIFTNDSVKDVICDSNLDSCEPRPLPQILEINDSQLDGLNQLTRKKRSVAFGPKNEKKIVIPNDGVFLLILYIQTVNKQYNYNLSVEIDIKGPNGYLSANDWPLPFYGVMSLIYLCYAVGWLIVSALQWKDLLRIQFWIGAVILLGMIEKAVFYLEYSNINSTGTSQMKGAILFAELVSCCKRSLSRMLVLIVSLGYGIVKPRLGPLLQRVLFVGILYFFFGSIEAAIRTYRPKNEPSNGSLMTNIPLATLDSIITWWIFTSLMQTTHTLKLRRNLVKHKLYRDFTFVLVLAVLSSIAFIIWKMDLYHSGPCILEWGKLWFETAYWHILFSSMLLIIMILFRPTNNNQRYAFTPLLDDESDDDDENILLVPEALSQGLKMRHHQKSSENDQEILFDRTKEAMMNKKKKEEELNTIVDTAFPILIDSEDELINKQLELSKLN